MSTDNSEQKQGAAKPKGLDTRHVFLDTAIYRRYGHDLNSKALKPFLALLQDHVFTLHITDITKREIERQIAELGAELAQDVNKANKRLIRWFSRSRWKAEQKDKLKDVNASELAKQAIQDFQLAMSMDWHPQIHMALSVLPTSIFDRYFAREAPFDGHESKEFPDAFAIEALDEWCKSKGARMYVVTFDKAMKRAAERTTTLIPVTSLDDLLQIVAEAQRPDIVEKTERFLENTETSSALQKSIEDQLKDLVIIYDGELLDGEIIEQNAGEGPIELEGFHVLLASPEQTDVLAKVTVPVIVQVQYQDISEAIYDKEDDEYFGAETAAMEIEQTITISVFLSIDNESREISDVEIVTKEVRVSEPDELYG